MKLNNKGMTIIEIMVSILLISIVLIMLMNLFLTVRTTYNQSKIASEYDVLVSNIINAVGSDIEEYGLRSVAYAVSGDKTQIKLTFNTFRSTALNERIVKILKVYFQNDSYYISYGYDPNFTENITSAERISNVVRKLPSDVSMSSSKEYMNYTTKAYSNGSDISKIKVYLKNKTGDVYDINIYAILET